MTTTKPRPTIAPGETRAYPVLPLRDIVVFPHVIVPLFVGRERSIRALEEAMCNDAFILLATQKNASDEDPATDAIFAVGTLASVLQLLKLPDGTIQVLVEGAERAKILKYTDRTDYHEANAVVLEDTVGERVEAKALVRSVVTEFESYARAGRRDPEGRALGGSGHGHRDRLGDDRHSGAPRRGNDRRDHAARPRAADRRFEGEAA